MLLLLPLLEWDDDVTVMLVVFIVGCVVVMESDPSCDAIMEVKVRLLGEELRTRFEDGTELEPSLLPVLPAIVVTGQGGGYRL
jgi:hypothetical protein